MKLSREININGTVLRVTGTYIEKVLGEEGALPLPAVFDIESVFDVKVGFDTKDLYFDMKRDIETRVIDVLESEDGTQFPLEDDEFTEEEADALAQAMGITKQLFQLDENINYSMEGSKVNDNIVPISLDKSIDDLSAAQIDKLIVMAEDIYINLNDTENEIVAMKISNSGIRAVRLTDINKIK